MTDYQDGMIQKQESQALIDGHQNLAELLHGKHAKGFCQGKVRGRCIRYVAAWAWLGLA